MKSKLFLTSFMVMSFLAPAMAEEFPQNGLMQENKIYDNAATSTNMDGVYEGEVDANAEFVYDIVAGKYLPASSDETVDCLAGSFCPGLSQYVDYSEDSAQGIEACPANYNTSATGASASTDCYRTCSTTDVAHSATVSGQRFYDGNGGDGVNACSATSCLSGWHIKAAIPDLRAVIGMQEGPGSASVNNAGNYNEDSGASRVTHGRNFYGISDTDKNKWAVYYGAEKGIVTGQSLCSTQSGYHSSVYISGQGYDYITYFDTLTDETGKSDAGYCYCRVTGYTPANGVFGEASSPWVVNGYVSNCASDCATKCADNMQYFSSDMYHSGDPAFRSSVLGLVEQTLASCTGNTINITWNDASAEDIAATGAATTVYEGDIKTPLKAVTKPGKTFVGWKFVKPAATPVEP